MARVSSATQAQAEAQPEGEVINPGSGQGAREAAAKSKAETTQQEAEMASKKKKRTDEGTKAVSTVNGVAGTVASVCGTIAASVSGIPIVGWLTALICGIITVGVMIGSAAAQAAAAKKEERAEANAQFAAEAAKGVSSVAEQSVNLSDKINDDPYGGQGQPATEAPKTDNAGAPGAGTDLGSSGAANGNGPATPPVQTGTNPP